ncbi:MAG TPA: alpha/beta hydrolase [Gemmatimonadaceae bacterium]|nr:alpha/beta hydrolase [Gemmatimonadaceae bacterium]
MDSGGAVVPVHGDLGAATSAVVLLVHGYANSANAARESWTAFLQGIADETVGGWQPRVVGVQWPGDEPLPVLNQASYPSKIGVARESAACVAEWLRSANGPGGAPMTISIVAHSLGCRLAVELLERIADDPGAYNVVVDRVVLMAGAVPTVRVDAGHELRDGAEFPHGTCALFSEGDDVLRIAFPIGETAGGDGFFPTAVGRHGGPGSTWTAAQQMAHSAGGLYGHSDYWPGREAARAAAAFLRLVVLAQPLARGLDAVAPPEPNVIGERTLASRALPVNVIH